MDVSDLALLADGRHLASAGREGKAAIWDISGSAHQVAALQLALFRRLTWSSNGACVASEDNRMTIQIWTDERSRSYPLTVPGQDMPSRAHSPLTDAGFWPTIGTAVMFGMWSTFSSSSTHVAAGHEDGSVRVWDMATRQEPLHWQAHAEQILDMAFSPDGRLLLSASPWEKTVRLWNAHTGAMVRSLEGHAHWVCKVCFSPCGKYIASASEDETVRVWRTSDGVCLATLSDHGGEVLQVAFTPDGTMLWSAAHNGTVLGRPLREIIPDEIEP
ncbi:WD40 repeat-like protein [Dichomitus squalens LYAD-421 SS1]|uniref:WD40 repeat-like protein n=1 Tax=Dichomitus squalens (strain LYAD-421) TaxID=732165 RepID=R7SRL9_DICSQ|nr:WD40 repeat-like protein [Dichomitus squalens LYAD-421 SS1]EJF58686.1 WD40 repeat-like protein [Dichomitus squalens LYAD-421 SS1]